MDMDNAHHLCDFEALDLLQHPHQLPPVRLADPLQLPLHPGVATACRSAFVSLRRSCRCHCRHLCRSLTLPPGHGGTATPAVRCSLGLHLALLRLGLRLRARLCVLLLRLLRLWGLMLLRGLRLLRCRLCSLRQSGL